MVSVFVPICAPPVLCFHVLMSKAVLSCRRQLRLCFSSMIPTLFVLLALCTSWLSVRPLLFCTLLLFTCQIFPQWNIVFLRLSLSGVSRFIPSLFPQVHFGCGCFSDPSLALTFSSLWIMPSPPPRDGWVVFSVFYWSSLNQFQLALTCCRGGSAVLQRFHFRLCSRETAASV